MTPTEPPARTHERFDCLRGRVSFFGVRELALVDMPDGAAEFLQRCGRVVRFNGHAGLPSSECDVRLRLYMATLPKPEPDEADEEVQEANRSADETRLLELEPLVKSYGSELRKLQLSAVDFDVAKNSSLWSDSTAAAVDDSDLQANAKAIDDIDALAKQLQQEAQAQLQAQLQAQHEAQQQAQQQAQLALQTAQQVQIAPPALKHMGSSFKTSRFLELYDSDSVKHVQISQLWDAARTLITYHKANAWPAYSKKLRKFIEEYCDKEGSDDDDVKMVAQLMWTSFFVAGGRELCSILNHCLREDRSVDDKVLKAATVLARAINKSIVVEVDGASRHQSLDQGAFIQWPNGQNWQDGRDVRPDEGRSTKRHTTWRGGQMPDADLQFYERLAEGNKWFRTKMYVATSFMKSVAEDFAKKTPDDSVTSSVIFEIQFEPWNCCHAKYGHFSPDPRRDLC